MRKHFSVAKFPEVSSDTCIECDVTDDVISRDVVYHVMHVWNFLGLGLRVYKELYCLWCMLTCLLTAYLLTVLTALRADALILPVVYANKRY